MVDAHSLACHTCRNTRVHQPRSQHDRPHGNAAAAASGDSGKSAACLTPERLIVASASGGALLLCVQLMPELRVDFLEGFGELYTPTCPRHAAEPPFLEVPVRAESGASQSRSPTLNGQEKGPGFARLGDWRTPRPGICGATPGGLNPL